MVNEMKRKLIIQILDYIDNHLFGKITIQELSDSFHYNRDYIIARGDSMFIGRKRELAFLQDCYNSNRAGGTRIFRVGYS